MNSLGDELIVKDIESWWEASSSLMADLEYMRHYIVHRGSKYPEYLSYYKETKIHLKAYNILSLWEKAKDYSETLKDEGKKALEQFNNKVNSIIDDLNLKKNRNKEKPYCNMENIREAVFTEIASHIKGKEYYAGSRIHPEIEYPQLNWGNMVLARADKNVLETLKKRIEELINNPETEQKIRLYEDVRAKMKENSYLKQFDEKIMNEIIKPFDMGIPLKGKCRFC